MLRTLHDSAMGLAFATFWLGAACSHREPASAAGSAPAAADSARSAAATPAQVSDSTKAPSAAPAPSSAAPSASPDSGFVQYDPATKTVTFRLVAGPFSFNGFSNGGATLTVPPGSNNVWNFEQNDGTPHSAEVASGTGPVPNSGGDPAIPRAYTNKVVEGLPQEAKDIVRFTAPDSGTYRIICGVPGHALSGMWIWLKIDPSAKTPSFGKS